jgi:hypothetical protein
MLAVRLHDCASRPTLPPLATDFERPPGTAKTACSIGAALYWMSSSQLKISTDAQGEN